MDVRTSRLGVFVFGAYRLDPIRRTLERNGAPVILPPRALDALLRLVENADRVVTKAEMLAALWPGRIVEEGSLSQLIFVLRKALADLDPDERFITTAPGRGYRFSVPVVFEPAAGPESVAAPSPLGPARPRRIPRQWLIAACVALVAVGVVGGGVAWRAASHLPAERRGVVLADFDNGTNDPVFNHILAKVLEVDLSQSPFLNVLPRSKVDDTLTLMTRPTDSALTPELAAQVCARNDGGAVIEGSIAALGAHFLVTLSATDCLSGRVLAEAKAEAGRKEETPAALDAAAGRIRRALGESVRSIHNFDVPILSVRTGSFEALRAYSEGAWLFNHGRRTEAVTLFQTAVELDPGFATAWAGLYAVLGNLHQNDKAAEAMAKAYALRDSVNTRERLHITALYEEGVAKDINAAIRTLKLSTTIYPLDRSAWANLSNQQNTIGLYDDAVASGRHALMLDDRVESDYAVLVRALTHAGRMAEARDVALRAIAKGVAGDDVRGQLAEIAYALGDGAEVQRQMDWARGKPAERRLLVSATLIAFSEGRVHDALALTDRLNLVAQRDGLGDYTAAGRARILDDMGLKAQALTLVKAQPADADTEDLRYELARIGDAARAEALLARDIARAPNDTLLVGDFAPSIRAAILLRGGQAPAAVAALAPAQTYAMREFDVPYQTGYTRLAAGDTAGAAASFRDILDHPGRAPAEPYYPLARLGLARALRALGDVAAARREYAAFLTRWKDADPDLPILVAAKAEAARLR